MEKVIASEKLPIKLWLDDLEGEALEQAKNIANLPFAFKHVSLMPDAHSGYGMPIGGVLATRGTVIPNCVGVDIGCGMCALKTSYLTSDVSTGQLKSAMKLIRDRIPMGFSHRELPVVDGVMPVRDSSKDYPVVNKLYEAAKYQLGTLGGGNHFIEIQSDQDDVVWLMVHSGSRNLGLKIANYYNDTAKYLNKIWHSASAKDLSFLPVGSKEFEDYFNEMKYAVEFAKTNRRLMMRTVYWSLRQVLNVFDNADEFVDQEAIDVAHNYAAFEHHFGEDVIVHRKGAVRARSTDRVIIPGSQGTNSYIGMGLGEEQSFASCSHGAGRKMGRSKAIKTLDLKAEIAAMNAANIVHGIRCVGDLDEAAGAYKNIEDVMANQEDLVKAEITLSPLAVIKK